MGNFKTQKIRRESIVRYDVLYSEAIGTGTFFGERFMVHISHTQRQFYPDSRRTTVTFLASIHITQ